MEGRLVQRGRADRLTNLPNPIIYHILSLMDTKYAVRTCVLSTKWRYLWRQIHSLHFDFSTARLNSKGQNYFGRFVMHVLNNRRPSNLRRLTFYCGDKTPPYTKRIFQYAVQRRVEELRTDFKDFGRYTLRTQEFHVYYYPSKKNCFSYSGSGFTSLTTLELSCFSIPTNSFFNNVLSSWLNLENVYLIDGYMDNLITVSAPKLVNLFISGLKFSTAYKKISIESAPRLELIDFSATKHIELRIHECPRLDKVNIRMPPPIAWRKNNSSIESYRLGVLCMSQRYSKAISCSLNFSQGKLKSHCVYVSEETKLVEIKETGKGKHFWIFDGATVWQSSRMSSYKSYVTRR